MLALYSRSLPFGTKWRGLLFPTDKLPSLQRDLSRASSWLANRNKLFRTEPPGVLSPDCSNTCVTHFDCSVSSRGAKPPGVAACLHGVAHMHCGFRCSLLAKTARYVYIWRGTYALGRSRCVRYICTEFLFSAAQL